MRSVNLFCGGGGFLTGARRAGVKVEAAFDVDEALIWAHHSNFPDIKLHLADVARLTGSDVKGLRPREKEYTVWDTRVSGPGRAAASYRCGIGSARTPASRTRVSTTCAPYPRQPRGDERRAGAAVVSRLLGLSSVVMTLRYAHLGDREIEAAAERVGQAVAAVMEI